MSVNGTTNKLKGCLLPIAFSVLMTVIMTYVFGFSVKQTKEYACALEQAKRSPLILRELGEPIEAGRMAILYSRESGGAEATTAFSTRISGPNGRGQIRASSHLAPVGSYLLVQYKSAEGWIDVYNGGYPCR
jgi:hypothetical protein